MEKELEIPLTSFKDENNVEIKKNDIEMENSDSELQVEFLRWMEEKKRLMNLRQEDEPSKMGGDDAIEKEENEDNESQIDFEEFKDVVDDDDVVEIMETKQQDDLMNVPLVIIEEDTKPDDKVTSTTEEANDVEKLPTCLPLMICENNVVEAKFTLTSSSPLEIVTSLSSSNSSLSSSTSRAKHNKGRAPPPPGHFYDSETKKFYRETEL